MIQSRRKGQRELYINLTPHLPCFEVFTAVELRIPVYCDVTLRRLVNGLRRFGGNKCLSLKSEADQEKKLFSFENWTFKNDETSRNPRRTECHRQISQNRKPHTRPRTTSVPTSTRRPQNTSPFFRHPQFIQSSRSGRWNTSRILSKSKFSIEKVNYSHTYIHSFIYSFIHYVVCLTAGT